MKDKRLQLYRSALDDVLESLNALVRLTRWYNPAEEAPALLQTHAAELSERLGAASRLAAAKFVGSETDIARVAAMGNAMTRLEAAYQVFQEQAKANDSTNAAMLLEAEVCEVESGAVAW